MYFFFKKKYRSFLYVFLFSLTIKKRKQNASYGLILFLFACWFFTCKNFIVTHIFGRVFVCT